MAFNSAFNAQEPHPAGWSFLHFLEDMTLSSLLENGVSHSLAEGEVDRYFKHDRCPTCQIDGEDEWNCAGSDRWLSGHKEIVPLQIC